MNWRKSLSLALITCALSACGSSAEKEATSEPAGPVGASEPAKIAPAEPGGPGGPKPAEPAKITSAQPVKAPPTVIEEPMFRLGTQGGPQYGADKDEKFKLVLEARGGYHVNEDYPIRVDLKSVDGVKFAKPSLVRADAASFGAESASFDVAFTAPKGEHEVVATVDFAVCTKETCIPDQRTLAVKLPVM